MTPERWRRIDELFRTVADRPLAEREALLTRVCGGDDELRREVLELLACDPPDSFLHDPIKHATVAVAHEPKDDLLNTRIGPYRLTRLIGHGGMGAVYEAVRDDDQFQHQVALKLIKRGMDSDFVRDRFLRERQILASLDHPHIARLFDGGTTRDGLPYFVMEFVNGISITDYCRQQELSLNDKLKLFRKVCSAVQHAHQKLVIHRDLKPSNILVTEDGTPKLLDFGIAKLLSPDLSEAFTRTETALRLMTPDYASPEQVRGKTITTATDVYSLGVVLYELLAEQRPYQFETYAPQEIERAICDTEAPRPSDLARHHTDARTKLAKQLTGDLDTIVLMALRKEPERRYQSVEQFSEDIRRYLSGLPITARPDTFGYRAGKFVRRHKAAVGALALLGLLTVALAILTVRLTRERNLAERRFAQVRTLSNTFLFGVHDKIQNVPGTIEARALVAQTAVSYLDNLSKEASNDPQLQWELAVAYQKAGDVQGDPWAPNIGESQAAMQSYQKSLALAQQLTQRGANDLKMARLLAHGYYKLGALQALSGSKATARETLSLAVTSAETLEAQTHDQNDLELLQNCLKRLGDIHLDMGDPASALANYRREMNLTERRNAEFPGDRALLSLAMSHTRLPEALVSLGEITEAMNHYHKALALHDELFARHSTDPVYLRPRMITLIWLGNISGNPRFFNLGDARTALRHYHAALALAEQLASFDLKNARAQQDLAEGYRLEAEVLVLDRAAQAIEHYRKALGIVRGLLASDSENAQLLRREAGFLKGLADASKRVGDRPGAQQSLLQARTIWQNLLARDPTDQYTRADLHSTLLALADLTLESGNHTEALAQYREALSLAEAPPVEQSADLYVRWRLADSFAGLSRYFVARADVSQVNERFEHWREARQYAEQSLHLWETLNSTAGLSSFNRRERDQIARTITRCDAALAKLNAPNNRQ
ncbi:MAG TPA: serine/threonine-protein kinase [Blastocatellia bacterium]|nr:serine/threonine-protein kinase [Blastocatellia bacterium]